MDFSERSENMEHCKILSDVIKYACYCTHSGNREGVKRMNSLFTFIVSIMQNVLAHYICRWLDGDE